MTVAITEVSMDVGLHSFVEPSLIERFLRLSHPAQQRRARLHAQRGQR